MGFLFHKMGVITIRFLEDCVQLTWSLQTLGATTRWDLSLDAGMDKLLQETTKVLVSWQN